MHSCTIGSKIILLIIFEKTINTNMMYHIGFHKIGHFIDQVCMHLCMVGSKTIFSSNRVRWRGLCSTRSDGQVSKSNHIQIYDITYACISSYIPMAVK